MAGTQSPLRRTAAGMDEPATVGTTVDHTALAAGHDWPRDEHGRPMIQVTAGAREVIGLENYSNIMVGPSSITFFVAQGDSEPFNKQELNALAAAMNSVSEVLEVEVVAEQRNIALGTVDPSQRKA